MNTKSNVQVSIATSSSTKKAIKILSSELQAQYNQLEGVSSKIRFLASLGWERGDIARFTNKRYQHVRNVLLNPLKKK